MKPRKSCLFLFLCCLFLAANRVLAGDLMVIDPWIREPPPGAKMLAAYMTIKNTSKYTVMLDGASSTDFLMISIHQTKMDKGMAEMVNQPHLQIEAGKSIVLEPGGYHLMLMKPKRSLRVGDTVYLQLHFDNGDTVAVKPVVRKE